MPFYPGSLSQSPPPDHGEQKQSQCHGKRAIRHGGSAKAGFPSPVQGSRRGVSLLFTRRCASWIPHIVTCLAKILVPVRKSLFLIRTGMGFLGATEDPAEIGLRRH